MSVDRRPTWQLPRGVSRGSWDYVTTPSIATEYDTYHGDHPLMQLDLAWIASRLKKVVPSQRQANVLLDLGCGTGRALLPWSRQGWRTIGIDLSFDMLVEARRKSRDCSVRPGFVHANLAEFDFFTDDFADAAICLYSSLGMIRGHRNRIAMLSAVRRVLKREGLFLVHAHNRGSWLRDPEGLRTTLRSYFRSWIDKEYDFGDRIFPYRGLPSMFLHIFSKSELIGALKAAGFAIESIVLLNRTSSGPLRWKWYFPQLRAGGFLVSAKKPA